MKKKQDVKKAHPTVNLLFGLQFGKFEFTDLCTCHEHKNSWKYFVMCNSMDALCAWSNLRHGQLKRHVDCSEASSSHHISFKNLKFNFISKKKISGLRLKEHPVNLEYSALEKPYISFPASPELLCLHRKLKRNITKRNMNDIYFTTH